MAFWSDPVPFLLFIGGQFEVPYGMMFLRPGRIIENIFFADTAGAQYGFGIVQANI